MSYDITAVVCIWANLVVLGLAMMQKVETRRGVFRSLLYGLMLFSGDLGKFLCEGVATEGASLAPQALLLFALPKLSAPACTPTLTPPTVP